MGETDDPEPEKPHDTDIYDDPHGTGGGSGGGHPTQLPDGEGGGGDPTTICDENGSGGNPTTTAVFVPATMLTGSGLRSSLVQVGPATFTVDAPRSG